MNRRVVVSVLLTVLAVAVLAAIGYGIYQVGFDRGVAAGAEIEVVTPETGTAVVRPYYGYPGHGWGFWPFGFIFPLFFFFLIFGLIGRAFWGRPWRGGGGWGGWGGPPSREQMEERLEEWHRKEHQAEATSSNGP